MNISITFRQMESTDAVKSYASEKVGRIQRFLRAPMTCSVTLSSQNRSHSAEVDVHSGNHHYHARETTDDMYATIDKIVDKLERQIRGDHEARNRKGGDRASDRLMPGLDSDE